MPLVERREACMSLLLFAKAQGMRRASQARILVAPFGAPLPHVLRDIGIRAHPAPAQEYGERSFICIAQRPRGLAGQAIGQWPRG